MKKEGLTGGLGWGSGTGCAIPGAFTCGVSGWPNPTHMHVHLPETLLEAVAAAFTTY